MTKGTKRRIHVRLDESLLADIERIQEALGLDRSKAIEHMLTGDVERRKRGREVGEEMTTVQATLWRRIREKPVGVRLVVMRGGVVPKRATAGSAGYDLCASESIVLPAQVPVAVGTGLRVSLPEGYEMQIRPRSGMALNRGISVLNSPGTIDSDYVGEVKVILFNTGMTPQTIEKGDRIAQAVISPVFAVSWIEAGSLADTERGEGGFGSTGVSTKGGENV